MRFPARVDGRRSGPPRRPAERERGDRDRGQDRVHRCAVGRRAAGHRSLRVRQPEMGAADGGCRGGLRRHRPAPFDPIHCARSESCRSRPGASRRCDRSRGVRGRVRVLQPPQHQPVDRRLACRPTAAVCARARELGMRVRGYVSTAFGCPFEGDVPPASVARVSAALVEMGCFEVAISDTIGVAHPGQVPDVVEAVARADRGSSGSRCTSTTRAEPRSPTCSRPSSLGSRRSTRRRAAWAGVRMRPARPGILRPKI